MTDLINLNNFLNNAIGFESFFERFNQFPTLNSGFPHYNIKRDLDIENGQEKYILEMALAGYKKSDIKVEVEDGVLSISGSAEAADTKYIHKGVAQRAFKKRLQLSEYVECKGAKLEDGMLKVELFYNPPENKKAKEIKIK